MAVEKRKFQDKQATGDSPKFPKLVSKGQQRYFNSPEGNGKAAGGGGGGGGGGRPNQNFNKAKPQFNKGGHGGGGKPNFNNRGGKGNFQQGKRTFNNSDGGDVKPKMELKTNEQPDQKPQPPQQNKNKNKQNKMKNKGNMNKGPLNKVSDESKAIKKAIKKEKNKSRFMKMQSSFDSKERSESACKAALALEQQLAPKSRVLTIKIQDPELTVEKAKSWSTAIEGVEINRIIGPRQILVFLKPNAVIKKEIEKLKKINFSGGNLIIEEKKPDSKEAGGDEVDPFSLYVTNLPDKITKEQLKTFFPKATRMSNIRKHNPKKGYVGKFMFIHYESEADALEGFKENFNRKIEDRMILIRFRRISANLDQNKKDPKTEAVSPPSAAAVNNKSLNKTPVNAKETPKKGQQQTPKAQDGKKATPAKPIKMEEEEESDDDDDSEEEASAPLKGKAALLKGLKAQVGQDDDDEEESSEDDEDDGLNIKEELDEDDDEDDDDDDEDEEGDEIGQAKASSDEDDDDDDDDDDEDDD